MRYGIEEISEYGKRYMRLAQANENGRFKSWEHCYAAFAASMGKSLSGADVDQLCLHLAFYLASWGMYRGSSFLLQKDYRVHEAAVRELMRGEYACLRAIRCEEYLRSPDAIHELYTLTQALRSFYDAIRKSMCGFAGQPAPKASISNTLITKILLGTLGCTPAYDQYFNKGVRACGVASAQYNAKSLRNLSEFYVENSGILEACRNSQQPGGIVYPQMKILDMCFWEIGMELSEKQK